MKIYVDIDETICFYANVREYNLAIPDYINISKINKLYDEGNEITYYTARGSLLKDSPQPSLEEISTFTSAIL